MTNWARVMLFVPTDDVDTANAMAAQLDFDTGGASTFTTKLSESGEEPTTFFGASTVVRPAVLQEIETKLLPQLPSATLYKGSDGWNWRKALKDQGLKEVDATISGNIDQS